MSLFENDTRFLFADGGTASLFGNPFPPLVPVSSDVTAPSFIVPATKTCEDKVGQRRVTLRVTSRVRSSFTNLDSYSHDLVLVLQTRSSGLDECITKEKTVCLVICLWANHNGSA